MEVTNRIVGLLLGLAVLAAGVLTLVETVLAMINRPGWLIDRDRWEQIAADLRWDDPALILIATIVALVALALALLQLWPARPRFLPLNPHAEGRRDAIDGRGLQTLLRRAAAEDQDVVSADVTVRRRKAKVTVRSPADADVNSVRDRVAKQIGARIEALQLQQPMSPRVRVQRSRERVR